MLKVVSHMPVTSGRFLVTAWRLGLAPPGDSSVFTNGSIRNLVAMEKGTPWDWGKGGS